MKCPKVRRVLQWSWEGVPVHVPKLRCCAPLKNPESSFRNPAKWDDGLDPKLCNFLAKYTVNGLFYCRKHGALRVLDLCDPMMANMHPAQRKLMDRS